MSGRTNVRIKFSAKFRALIGKQRNPRRGSRGFYTSPMSSGKRKPKRPFNKSIIRDGMIVILHKDGREKMRLPMEKKKDKKS